MSIILDALRRRTERVGGGGAGRTPQPDAILATLGYPRHPRSRRSLRTLAAYGFGAIVIGFVAVAVPVYFLTSGSSDGEGPSVRGGEPIESELTPPRPPLPEGRSPIGTQAPQPAPEPGPAPPERLPSVGSGRVAGPTDPVTRPTDIGTTQPPRPAQRPTERPVAGTAARPPAPLVTTAPPPPAAPVPPSAAAGQPSVADHFGLALYYQRVGDFTNALAAYRVLLETNEASAAVHNNLGLLYQDRGDADAAIARFQRAIEIDPRHVSAHNNLGVALLRTGRFDAASAQFTIALDLDPRNLESLVNLGLAHQAEGRLAQARALLQRALAIEPRHPGTLYNAAVVADEIGDVGAATEYYRAFLRYGTVEYPDLVAPVRSRLSALGS